MAAEIAENIICLPNSKIVMMNLKLVMVNLKVVCYLVPPPLPPINLIVGLMMAILCDTRVGNIHP